MSVENIRKLQDNTATLYTERKTLRVSAIRRSGHVCPGKLKCPPILSGCETSGCEISDQRIRTCLTGQNSGGEISGRRKGDRLCVQGVGTPSLDDTERALLSGTTPSEFPKRTRAAMLSGLPQGEAHDTREHHTPDDSISYPDMLSGWKTLTKVSKSCYVIPTACHNSRSAALQWCVRTPCPDIFCHGFQRNSPQSRIALVIKKLSKHQNLTQFD